MIFGLNKKEKKYEFKSNINKKNFNATTVPILKEIKEIKQLFCCVENETTGGGCWDEGKKGREINL